MKRKRGSPRGSDAVVRPAGPSWAPPAMPPWALAAGLAVALVALLAHVRTYLFLTDDAFISFRYARNLSHGFGLVFNPGGERVEGYSNFLWVLILAALDRVGLAPERAANVLSIAMTVALWAIVAWFAWRTHRSPRLSWAILVPAVCFAATRSLAVWASSGLETRMFELLVIGGLVRLILETEAAAGGSTPRRPIAPLLFALACLTRPDGVLLAASAFGVTALFLVARGRAAVLRFVLGWIPFALVVGGQFAFRRVYYHEWFPNTYYAKAEGLQWWDSGVRYLSAFALEYAAYLWVPLLVGALLFHFRRRSAYVPALFAAIIVPHAIYVAAIGGDHFEYRPLDLYLPLLFLLLGDGVRAWSERRALALALPVYLALVLVGLFELPWQTHRQFVTHYLAGFPGKPDSTEVERGAFALPENDPVYRLPGLRAIAAAHRERLVTMSTQFVAIRQEEHRLFLGTVVPEGRRLRAMVEQGVLPADLYVAMDCVGAIPYYSQLRTLDRLGLTDAHIAHSPSVRKIMAHSKSASMEYARARGVDLWNQDPVHSLLPLTSANLLAAINDYRERARVGETTDTAYAAPVEGGLMVVGKLPHGVDAARARMPALRFQALDDPVFLEQFIAASLPAYEALLRDRPGNIGAEHRMAYLAFIGKRYPQAYALYRRLDQADPDNGGVVEKLALCEEAMGDTAGARRSMTRALALAATSGDRRLYTRLMMRMEWLGTAASRR